MNYSAVIVAAGSSSRFKAGNKLLYKFDDGKTVIEKSMDRFLNDSDCKQVIVVVSEQTNEFINNSSYQNKVECVFGGLTRSQSVFNGLSKCKEEIVMIHDGARCFLSARDLNILKEAFNGDGLILVANEVDTIKRVDENGYIIETIDRNTLKRALTPQMFKTADIIKYHLKAQEDCFETTDDAALYEHYNLPVKTVTGLDKNIKITTQADVL